MAGLFRVAYPVLKFAYKWKKRSVPKNPKRILLFRIGAIGDVVMTTPLIRALAKKFPSATIDYLVGNWAAGVLKNNPHLHEIITFDDEIVFKKKMFSLYALARRIKKRKYDVVLVLDRSYLAGSFAQLFDTCTIGFNRGGEGIMHHAWVPDGDDKHDIEFNLDVGGLLGAKGTTSVELFPSAEDTAKARILWKDYELDKKKKVIGLCPGGAKNPGQSVSLKRWPHFAQLAKQLVKKKYTVVVFGAASDAEFLDGFPKEAVSFVGKTSLLCSAALMKKCDMIITNDSGPMHLASAMCKRVIALFGPTNPVKLRPLGKGKTTLWKEDTKCPPCNPSGRPPCYQDGWFPDCPTHACMKNLSVKEVMTAVEKGLK